MPATTSGIWELFRQWLGHDAHDERRPPVVLPGSQRDPEERNRVMRKQADISRRLEVLEIEAGVSARRPPRVLPAPEEWT